MKGWKKWLIFALWCLWYLCNHAATLIQPIWYQRAHDKEGGEREGGRRRREAEFWSKRGRKRATDWEKAGRIIELLGPGVQMRNVGRISSGERLKRQRRGGGRASEREQRCRGRERERGGDEGTRCRRARHDKVLNRVSLIARCAWLRPALSPRVLVREAARCRADSSEGGEAGGGQRPSMCSDTVKGSHLQTGPGTRSDVHQTYLSQEWWIVFVICNKDRNKIVFGTYFEGRLLTSIFPHP